MLLRAEGDLEDPQQYVARLVFYFDIEITNTKYFASPLVFLRRGPRTPRLAAGGRRLPAGPPAERRPITLPITIMTKIIAIMTILLFLSKK